MIEPFSQNSKGDTFFLYSHIYVMMFIYLLLFGVVAVSIYFLMNIKRGGLKTMPIEASFGGKKIIIIGSGIAGIKLAHTLAKRGIKSLIIES